MCQKSLSALEQKEPQQGMPLKGFLTHNQDVLATVAQREQTAKLDGVICVVLVLQRYLCKNKGAMKVYTEVPEGY